MSKRRMFSQCCAISSLFFLFLNNTFADPVDPDAPEVSVKTNCAISDDTCFSDLTSLNNWIGTTRNPTPTTPLLVNIGPGHFPNSIALTCSGGLAGNTTYRGSGRQTTTVGGAFINGSCKNLSFESMTLDNSINPIRNLQIGVWFIGGGGSATWKNMEIIGDRAAWYDALNTGGTACPTTVKRQKHLFFSSTLKLSATAYPPGGQLDVFFSSCSETKFWGSEIRADIGPGFTTASNQLHGVRSIGAANIVRLFGVNVHMVGQSDGVAADPIALKAEQGGQIHSHGGEIVSRHAGAVNASVIGAWADGEGSSIHTPETSFGLLAAGTGQATRTLVTNGGIMMSPFQWQPSATPPMHYSEDGMDSIIETDCYSNGCNSSNPPPLGENAKPHYLVYSVSCRNETGDPWFDTVLGECR